MQDNTRARIRTCDAPAAIASCAAQQRPRVRRSLAAVLLAAAFVAGVAQALTPPVLPLTEVRVNETTAGDQQNAAVARAPDGRFVVVWEGDVDGRGVTDIFARRHAADGTPLGPEFIVNSFRANRQVFPAVAINASGEFIVAWDSDGQDTPALNAYAQRYNADGTPRGGEFRINNGGEDIFTRISVALDDAGNAIFVWPERLAPIPVFASIRRASINLRIFDNGNAIKLDQLKVEESIPTNLRLPTVGVAANGDFVIVWQSTAAPLIPVEGFNSTGVGIYGRRYNAAGVAQGASFQVDAAATSNPLAGLRLPIGNGPPTMFSDRPNIAVGPAGDFVVVWQRTGTDFSSLGAYGRRYGADGVARGGEFRIGSGNLPLRSPAVATTPDGGFAVVAQGAGIVLQRYNAQGAAVGSERRIDQGAAPGNVLLPNLAFDAVGRASVVWQDYERDGAGRGIVAAVLPAF